MTVKPLRDIILIKLDSHPIAGFDKDGNPVKPQIWHQHKPKGTLLELGPDVKTVKKGERVLVNPYAIIDVPETKEMLIKECDILAVIEGEDGEQEKED